MTLSKNQKIAIGAAAGIVLVTALAVGIAVPLANRGNGSDTRVVGIQDPYLRSQNGEVPAKAPSLEDERAKLGATAGPQCCPEGFTGKRAYDDCFKYYQCNAGKLVEGSTVSCGGGARFDQDTQLCSTDTRSACAENPCLN